MKRVFILLLSVILLLSCTASFGCGTKKEETKEKEGTHEKEVKDTENFILKSGECGYKIVIPENASEDEVFASEEFGYFFKDATGFSLPVIKDTGLTYNEKDKYFSIGRTSLLSSANVAVEKSVLGRDGVKIKTVGNTVFLCGGEDDGTIFSVYVLLENLFNYDCFYTDCYYIDTGVSELKLMEYDITDVPDFAYRIPSMGYLWDSTTLARRMRYNDYFCYDEVYIQNPEKIGSTKSLSQHNSFYYLPPEYYLNPSDTEHYRPEWFSNQNSSRKSNYPAQLCYTAHGDSAKYDEMVEEIFSVMKFNLMRDKKNHIISLAMQDDFGACTCSACIVNKEKYGADSASVVLMCNVLAEKIAAWFETPEGSEYKRDLKVGFLAYHSYEKAPMKFNSATGKNEPTDIKGFNKKVGDVTVQTYVLYAPIFANYLKPMTDVVNKDEYDNISVWSEICSAMSVWQYSANYSPSARGYMIPLNTFNSQQANYRLYFNKGADWIFSQGQHNQTVGATGWMILRTYLDSKLAWNCNIDYNYYLNKFFKNYFGVCETEMLNIFNLFRAQAMIAEDKGYNPDRTAYTTDIAKPEYWPMGVLLNWLSLYDKALTKIDGLKETDKYLYNTLYKHIAMERLSVYYLLVTNYSEDLGDYALQYKLQFKNDVNLTGLTMLAESGNIGGLITDDWEI